MMQQHEGGYWLNYFSLAPAILKNESYLALHGCWSRDCVIEKFEVHLT